MALAATAAASAAAYALYRYTAGGAKEASPAERCDETLAHGLSGTALVRQTSANARRAARWAA